MDPITGAIVAALVAKAATTVLPKAYTVLKDKIQKKFGPENSLVKAIDTLEEKPASKGLQTFVQEEVQTAKAEQDPDLVNAAKELLKALEKTSEGKAAMGKFNIQMDNSEVGVIGENTTVHGGVHMHRETRNIHKVGGNYYEHITGDVTTGPTIVGENARQVNVMQQYADHITPDSPKEDVAQLLKMGLEELNKLDIPEGSKEEVAAELNTAAIQVKKDEPDKPKIADRLKSAAEALKAAGGMGVQAVALGNMIGKAILWCGENWPT